MVDSGCLVLWVCNVFCLLLFPLPFSTQGYWRLECGKVFSLHWWTQDLDSLISLCWPDSHHTHTGLSQSSWQFSPGPSGQLPHRVPCQLPGSLLPPLSFDTILLKLPKWWCHLSLAGALTTDAVFWMVITFSRRTPGAPAFFFVLVLLQLLWFPSNPIQII